MKQEAELLRQQRERIDLQNKRRQDYMASQKVRLDEYRKTMG